MMEANNRENYPNTVAVQNYEQVVADQQADDWQPEIVHETVKNF